MPDLLDRLKTALADRYAIEREIGAGGMATVYLARDLKHDRQVAVKVLRPELAAVVGAERFLQEIQIAAKLNHPHILTLIDSGEADGFLYYVMPYVKGESLADKLRRETQLSIEEALAVTKGVASALGYAHAQGVIHRDIKPGNILMHEGEAIVADFGIALALHAAGAHRLTETGLSLGTPEYMSPEQATADHQLDARSDIYSLAAVLYEMLAGEPPHTGHSTQAIIAKLLTERPVPVHVLRDTVPEVVDRTVMKALARLPADRFTTAAAFAEGLLESPQTTGIQEGTRKRTQSTRTIVVSGIGIALVVSVAATVALRSGTDLPFDKRDWILITDFENETDDAAFDRSLHAALNIAIQQSGHVNVVQRARMDETLQMMQRDEVETIDEPLAREIAIRNNVPVVIVPSITRLDSAYTLAYRAVDPTTGDVLRTRSFRAANRVQILESLDDLARRLRRDLGESWFAVARRGTPVDLATTPSLEALVLYTEARRQFNARNYDEARPLYERAIELDSNFAMAHVGLGMFFLWVESDRVSGDEHLNKALALSDRLTGRERLLIEADRHFFQDNFQRAISAYKIFTVLYPDDVSPQSNLGLAYMRLNLFDEAITILKQVISQDPDEATAYINLATSFSASDEPDSALQYYHQGFALRPEWRLSGNLNHEFGFTYAAAGDLDGAEQTFTDMLAASNDQQAGGARSLGLLRMYEGKYHEATDQLKRAVITTQLLDYPTSELRNHLYLATVFRALGDAENYLQELSEAHRIGVSQPITPVWIGRLAKLYFRSGLTTEAHQILDTLEARRDSDNSVDNVYWHLLRGERALAAEQYAEATQQLEMAYTLQGDNYTLESLAYGYMMSGDLETARAKYEELISRRQLGWEGQEYWILAHYELGGIYEALGDTTRAVEYYDRFLNIWRDGDDELLALRAARTRLEALSGPG